ncbi:MAG: hypothetical protein KF864_03570 [Phycisphaeraceae bacterium]|nr:hypothetical protein [Phycisphaeraceae bacterium]
MLNTTSLKLSLGLCLALTPGALAGWTSATFAGGDAGFNTLTNNGSLERSVAEGRIGNGATSGTWERALWQQGGVGMPQAQGQFTFASAASYDWSVSWDGIDTVTFVVDGQSLSWGGVQGAFTDIFIRTRSGADSTILLSGMQLNAQPIAPASLFSSGNGDVDYIRLSHTGGPAPAFTLSGSVAMTYDALTRPNNSALAWQVKLTNVIPAPGALAVMSVGLVAAARRRRA